MNTCINHSLLSIGKICLAYHIFEVESFNVPYTKSNQNRVFKKKSYRHFTIFPISTYEIRSRVMFI